MCISIDSQPTCVTVSEILLMSYYRLAIAPIAARLFEKRQSVVPLSPNGNARKDKDMKTLSTLLNLTILTLTLIMMGLALAIPAQAASKGYAAQLATAGTAAKMVANDTLWKCNGADCRSMSQSGSRAEIICAAFVKKAGRVTSFSVNGTAFDAAKLEKCNVKAKA